MIIDKLQRKHLQVLMVALLSFLVVSTGAGIVEASNPIIFTDSGQVLGNYASIEVAMGDVDGDGDADAFIANGIAGGKNPANRVYLNDGSGNFTDSGQTLGIFNSWGAALGDLDGDGDLDAFVINHHILANGANRVYLNDGSGIFTDSGQTLGAFNSRNLVLGDVDGDGDLDAFVINDNQPNRVYLNDGSGNFTDSGQTLGTYPSGDVAMGDVDGDGDLDAFVGNFLQPDRVYTNNGSGIFTDSGQTLGTVGQNRTTGVALGDVDGDGDLDAFVNNYGEPNLVYTNDGNGTFTDSGQTLGAELSRDVELEDLDGDGDLDAFVANFNEPNQVYENDGSGTFTDTGIALGATLNGTDGVALADVDGDGDFDAFVANFNTGNHVFMNGTQVVIDCDTTPPDTSITDQPADPTNITSADFEFSGTDDTSAPANLTFECKLDGVGSYGACTSPKNYSGLGDGSHTFEVRATDEAGNSDPTPASFSWVVDTVPPVVTVPADQEVVATGPVAVTYPPATATDTDPLNPAVSCAPPSGSIFPIGDTSVTCSATDTAGNIGQESFTVTVLTPQEATEDLIEGVQDLVDNGTLKNGNALISKLENVIAKLDNGNTNAACNQLGAFTNQVNAYINSGKLTPEEGQQLIDAVTIISDGIGC